MSVACITDPLHVVGIADELEAFWNVLMYNSIRYLPHNQEDHVAPFVFTYFSRPLQSNAVDLVRRKTQLKDTQGELILDGGAVQFGTPEAPNEPLNSVIGYFLEWLQARYRIREYEASEKLKARTVRGPSRGDQADATEASSPRPTQKRRVQGGKKATYVGRESRVIKRPDDTVYADASKVETHDDPLEMLRWALEAYSWPKDDRDKDHMHNLAEPKVTVVFGDITYPKSDPSQGDVARQGILRLGHAGVPVTKRRSQGSGSIQMAFTRSIPQ